jgi:ribosomal-protein-alanine N-acetyltransferase
VSPDTPAASARLHFRPWDPAHDADAALAIYGDPRVSRHIGGYTPETPQQARVMLEKWGRATAAYAPRYNAWAAVHHNEVVGTALLKPLPAIHQGRRTLTEDIEVGWHLGHAWWGRGLATEMGMALLQHGFSVLGLPAIHCVIEVGNERSTAVARRLEMVPQGSTANWYGKTLLHFRRDA